MLAPTLLLGEFILFGADFLLLLLLLQSKEVQEGVGGEGILSRTMAKEAKKGERDAPLASKSGFAQRPGRAGGAGQWSETFRRHHRQAAPATIESSK